jgi:hypothetical protein
VANLPPVLLIRGNATSVVDTGGKFAASMVDNGGKFSKVGVQIVFQIRKSQIRKFLGSIRNQKIHKFLRYVSSKISNLQISFDRTAHCKSANLNFPT